MEYGHEIKASTLLHEHEANPFKYILWISALYLVCLISPQQKGLDILLGLACAGLFVLRPLIGVFFIIAVHSIMSCSFELIWTADQQIKLNSCGDPLSVHVNSVILFPFQIASFLLIPSLLFHCRPSFSHGKSELYRKISYTTLSLFFVWSIFVSCQANHPDVAFFGLSRFASITILIAYLIRFVDKADTLRKCMITYCCSAIVMSFLAYYGTYNGFENVSYVLCDYGLGVIQRQSLINGSTVFNPSIQGMLPGFGISAKHEFSTFVVAGFFFSLYLFVTIKSRALSIFYLLATLTIFLSLFYGPSKLSLVGIIIAVFFLAILCPVLRRNISVIGIILVALIIFGFIASNYTRPLHARLMSSSTQDLKVVNDASEFSTSMKGRIAIMKKTIRHVKQSNGIGIGPDMLNHDPIFTHVHGHNILLTLLAEYGFPAIICIFVFGILLYARVVPVILYQICPQDMTSLAVLPITASFLAVLFEYNFDCFAWGPQLYISGSLLWISANMVKTYQNNYDVKHGVNSGKLE